MANILTASEGAIVLRCEATDTNLLALLPQVDAYIERATGHDWASDSTIAAEAKSAARMLLVMWHEDPGMMAAGGALSFGLQAVFSQLEIIAWQYKEFTGRDGAGSISLMGARAGDTVASVTGLIGATGDQKSAFETVISVDDEIQQVSTADLSANWYRVNLTPVEDL